MALSWQFDSDFIIRAWFYNKQELSCPIRHARWRSPSPPDSLHPYCPPPTPYFVRGASNIGQILSLCISLCVCLGGEQEGSYPVH